MARLVSFGLDIRAADNPDKPITAVIEYADIDPLAVQLTFLRNDGSPSATYEFARSLLAKGLYETAGIGDVTIQPHIDQQSRITMILRQVDGYPFEVETDREVLTEFSDIIHLLVPSTKDLDVDAELAALFGGGH